MSYSNWLKMDLHIHSHESNKTKDNDYDGVPLTYEKLITALESEKVNFFSITDHNTINSELYNELIDKREKLLEKNINFIVGVELDFNDIEVHDKDFHMLTFFDSYDTKLISQLLADLFGKETKDDIDKSVSPINLKDFFKKVFSVGIENVITIPHFNQKDKGIPANDIDKFVYTVFNALEDSNNRNRLIKSISKYKEHNFTDVPVVVFSDNHNIDIYPSGKDKKTEKLTSMYTLGNINFPFNSIKAAFQDVKTRVSIKDIGQRNISHTKKYIKSIKLDDEEIGFSPYQNSIIGGFGTGKSFLLDLILNGRNGIDKNKYNELINEYSNFIINFSDGTTRNSLDEISSDVKIIRFNQYKNIYFKEKLFDQDKNILERNLHISFPILDTIEEFDPDLLLSKFIDLEANINNTSSITDILNYDALSRSCEKEYSIKDEYIESLFSKPDYLEDLISNLQSEYKAKVYGNSIYSNEEKDKIKTTEKLILEKNDRFEILSHLVDEIDNSINDSITKINNEVNSRNSLISSNLKILEEIKNDIIDFSCKLNLFKNESIMFEEAVSESTYNKLKDYSKEEELHSYRLVSKYDAHKEMPKYSTDIFKQSSRKESFYKSVLTALDNKDGFTQGQTLDVRLRRFVNNFYSNFRQVIYDIVDEEKSILRKSAGEKANVIINLIFDIIENYSTSGISSIVILDQPEDNLDNKGIQKQVVDRIRNMKISNRLPQLICVTHNANISITADSENIIVASKIDNKSHYINSGIEDLNFISEVCKTVEGGITALKKRGVKFNIPMIKEIEMEV